MARSKATELSEYELQRQEKIAKNQELLRSLQLEAASSGLAPSKSRSATPSKSTKKKATPVKRVKEEILPRRTSSRLRGIVADSEVAKRKAEEEYTAVQEAERAKRQRVSDDLNLGDIVVGGKHWNQSGNFLVGVGPARPNERTFSVEDVKETTDKELKALREKMSGLELWEDYEPNRIKITPERIYSLGFHPTRDKALIFGGDKLGNMGIFDNSQSVPEVKAEDEDEEEEVEGPPITTLKPHTRTICDFKFSPSDYNVLYTASYDSSIRKMDLAKSVAIEVYAPADKSVDAPVSAIDMSHTDAHTIYFTTLEGAFGMHDIRTKPTDTETYQLSEKKIGGFTLHPLHPHLVATASLDRTLKIWDLRKISGKDEWRIPSLVGEHESRLSVSHAAFNSAGQVATASYDDTVKIHDFSGCGDWKVGMSLTDAQLKPATIIPHNNQTGRWVTILRAQWQLQPEDGIPRFCIGNMNRFVDIYTSKGQQLAQLGGEGITAVPAVAKFHPSINWVAGGTASGKLCLWM
ncbi:WD repeat-containing protein [Patellaria atrata CBS 101060]|uniref:DNA damage-binding protein CMR1 n=1 Tax=Patellaria atrata CBS 101060 TaxID=1346257 RepID=A0A9P4S2X8_9PEZI|nr:WD repeat-containing protein [Patellaria atrata CBS 101060]